MLRQDRQSRIVAIELFTTEAQSSQIRCDYIVLLGHGDLEIRRCRKPVRQRKCAAQLHALHQHHNRNDDCNQREPNANSYGNSSSRNGFVASRLARLPVNQKSIQFFLVLIAKHIYG